MDDETIYVSTADEARIARNAAPASSKSTPLGNSHEGSMYVQIKFKKDIGIGRTSNRSENCI